MGLMIDKPAKTLIERFAQKQPGGHFACPRCGKMTMDAESVTHNALSRRIGCYICDTCGTVEALEDFAHKQNSLNVWAITKEPELWRMLSWNSDGIEIAGHEGTWYVIDEGDFQITPDVDGKPETLTAHLFLLESELYGEDAAGLIVNDEKQIVMEDLTGMTAKEAQSGTASTIWKTPGGRKRGRLNAQSARASFCGRT